MKYKIQIQAVNGWSDLKHSDDDGITYILDEYDSIEEAKKELEDIAGSFGDDPDEDYRIVPLDTDQDFNLYS